MGLSSISQQSWTYGHASSLGTKHLLAGRATHPSAEESAQSELAIQLRSGLRQRIIEKESLDSWNYMHLYLQYFYISFLAMVWLLVGMKKPASG